MQIGQYLEKYQPVIYKTFINAIHDEKLSHAYLLSGSVGMPLKETAMYLAKSLVCDIKDKNGIGVELVAIRTSLHNNDKLYGTKPLKLVKTEGSRLYFELPYQLNYAGSMKFAMRMYPQNDLLPHRMDFAYVRWI